MDSAPKDLAALRILFDGVDLALVGALALEVQGVKRPDDDDRRYLGPAADQGYYREEAAAWHLGHELAF